MKRKSFLFFVILALFVVSIALIVSWNADFLKSFIEGKIFLYGYPAVFAFSFLTDIIDQPIGPEVPASFAVVFGLDPLYVFLFSCRKLAYIFG